MPPNVTSPDTSPVRCNACGRDVPKNEAEGGPDQGSVWSCVACHLQAAGHPFYRGHGGRRRALRRERQYLAELRAHYATTTTERTTR